MKTLIKKIFSTVMCMVMLVTGTAFYTLAADSKKIDYYQKIQEEIAEFESLNIDECSLADYDYAFYGITIAKQAKPDDSEEVLKKYWEQCSSYVETDKSVYKGLSNMVGGTNAYKKGYYIWNQDNGEIKFYKYTESEYGVLENRIADMFDPGQMVFHDAKNATDLIFMDNYNIADGTLHCMQNLRTVRFYNDIKIGQMYYPMLKPSFTDCSNPYGPVVVYGTLPSHKEYADLYGLEYKDLSEYEVKTNPITETKVDSEQKLITGVPMNIKAKYFGYIYFKSSGCDIVPAENGGNIVGTGTKFNVVKWIDGSVADTYTAVLFGDVDGDGKYDGADAYKVNLMVNGHLTKEQVGNEIWAAADCNHDGVIDASDVALLERAGLLLSSIDQSKTPEELKSDEAYIEYESLIDQSAEPNADIVAEPDEPEEKSDFAIFIEKIIAFIKEIISRIIAIIK